MTSYAGMQVVVTGAASGLGRCTACAYARQGASLILLDRDRPGLDETVRMIQCNGGAAAALLCDLSVPGEIDAAFATLSCVHVLINNAGIGITAPMQELTVAQWDLVLNTNLRGTFLCTRRAAEKMPAGGSVVNIASSRAVMSEQNTEAYSASKGGILSLTHAMAVSLSDRRIRVNAVSPGWIETGDYSALRPEDHSQHPSRRVGTPDDISRACLFLTDPDNDFITGANLVVDGGMTRKMIYLD